MAKERAIRRAAREADRAARIAAARERQAQKQRRMDRTKRIRSRLTFGARPGLLAGQRRRRMRVLVLGLVLLNVLIWRSTDDLAATSFSVLVTLLIAPMLFVVLIGRWR